METTKQVAGEILRQYGGNRFALITGAKNFMSGRDQTGENKDLDYLMFRVPAAGGYKWIVKTYYDAGFDLYNVRYYKVKSLTMGNLKAKKSVDGVDFEQMVDIFEQVTGIYATLAPRK